MFTDKGGYAKYFFGQFAEVVSSSISKKSGNEHIRVEWQVPVKYFEGYTTAPVSFGGIYSSNGLTNVVAHPTQNKISFNADPTNYSTFIDANGVSAPRLTVDDIRIDGNTISTTLSNSNLEFGMHGTGKFVLEDLKIKNNILEITDGGPMTFVTNDGYFAFRGSSGIVVPNGGNETRGTNNQIGDTRFNNRADVRALEVYSGAATDDKPETWIPATGAGESVTIEYQEDQVNIWSIVLG